MTGLAIVAGAWVVIYVMARSGNNGPYDRNRTGCSPIVSAVVATLIIAVLAILAFADNARTGLGH